ncbi:glycosyltransferase family 1 protein [Nocardia amamiensis]|uniref:Glycosyltransferase family 1 protein n=1 Tax=Nocardia amamiensis TaxID=404578 RepID=A0ABS0CXP8_9NOCA|nr:glycosyltransferase [Nocardia amamiensis]MBF6301375.1 glycosyltransferase family 1 protein [Nocardia amamiensis]
MGRYLLAASPIPGHVLPILSIGADMVRRGHSVRLLTGREFITPAAVRGMRAVALPGRAETTRLSAGRGYPAILRRWRAGRAELLSVFLAPMVAQYAALRAELEREPAEAIMVDLAFTGAIPLLLSGRPRPAIVVCGVGPLTVSSIDTAPFGTGWQPRPGVTYARMNRFTHGVLFRDVQARLDRILNSVQAARMPVFLTDWPVLADRILQLTVPTFEYPRRDLPHGVLFTGPLPAADDAAEWKAPPAARSRIRVHVTQGTWDNTDPTQLIVPTLEGLAERDDLEVIATTGRSVSLPIAPPGNAHVMEFCAYSALLPTVEVMITNGGYGGVHAALAHGVPLVVAGDSADKPEVAARVAHFGVGIDLRTARPTAHMVATAVDRVLATQSYRRAAAGIASDIAATRPYEVIEQALAEHAARGPRPIWIPRHDSPFLPTEELP